MNQTILIIFGAFLAALTGAFLAGSLVRRKKLPADDSILENKISKVASEALDKNSERFLQVAREVLSSQKNEIKIDLEGKKSVISELVNEIRKDLKKNEERLSQSDKERIDSFSSLKSELENYKKITGELKLSTDELKSILSNNQTRGAFGEQVAENLLKMAGFVIGQDYNKNKAQGEEKTRPDITIFLPDKTKINIDVKFPYSSLVKTVESENATEKKKYFAAFRQDVRDKIKQVTTRDYINPQEKTVDFVILFIPNEMIFSYIYDKMNDVWEEAMKKKVVLAGPFSFTAILRMIKQAYTNFSYQENLQHIIGLIQKFDNEYQKFCEEMNKLGDRISSTSKQYEVLSTTRNRQLTSVVDKIKNQEINELASSPELNIDDNNKKLL